MKNTLDIILKLIALIGIVFLINAYLDSRYETRIPREFRAVTHSEEVRLTSITKEEQSVVLNWPHLPAKAQISAVWISVSRGLEHMPKLHRLEAIPEADGKIRLYYQRASDQEAGPIHLKGYCAYGPVK
jgi:hypothetical protein